MRIERKILSAVIGIGINVNADMDVFPEEVRGLATSLMNETGITYPRARIISEILNEMDIWYRTLKNSGGKKILSEWKRLTSTLGKQVMVTVGQETFRGVAESVDDKGMLVLRLDSGEPKRISAGDLTVLR